MTRPAPSPGRAPVERAPGRRRALVALSVTQNTGWGVLYYALPVALPSITEDTGWSATAVTAAFSVALVTSAVVGIPVGHWLDRHGPRRVMTTGSVLGSLGGVGIATAPDYPTFVLAWLVAGGAMAAGRHRAAARSGPDGAAAPR